MKLEEAIVYVLASSGYGMKTEHLVAQANDIVLIRILATTI